MTDNKKLAVWVALGVVDIGLWVLLIKATGRLL